MEVYIQSTCCHNHVPLISACGDVPILHLTTQDVYGFNLAGLGHLKREMESRGTAVFGDAPSRLSKARKTRKLTVYQA